MSTRKRPIVALVYDFDGTLSPGNMQEFGFIEAIGKKPQEFWQESDDIASGQDASNILSYMKLCILVMSIFQLQSSLMEMKLLVW